MLNKKNTELKAILKIQAMFRMLKVKKPYKDLTNASEKVIDFLKLKDEYFSRKENFETLSKEVSKKHLSN